MNQNQQISNAIPTMVVQNPYIKQMNPSTNLSVPCYYQTMPYNSQTFGAIQYYTPNASCYQIYPGNNMYRYPMQNYSTAPNIGMKPIQYSTYNTQGMYVQNPIYYNQTNTYKNLAQDDQQKQILNQTTNISQQPLQEDQTNDQSDKKNDFCHNLTSNQVDEESIQFKNNENKINNNFNKQITINKQLELNQQQEYLQLQESLLQQESLLDQQSASLSTQLSLQQYEKIEMSSKKEYIKEIIQNPINSQISDANSKDYLNKINPQFEQMIKLEAMQIDNNKESLSDNIYNNKIQIAQFNQQYKLIDNQRQIKQEENIINQCVSNNNNFQIQNHRIKMIENNKLLQVKLQQVFTQEQNNDSNIPQPTKISQNETQKQNQKSLNINQQSPQKSVTPHELYYHQSVLSDGHGDVSQTTQISENDSNSRAIIEHYPEQQNNLSLSKISESKQKLQSSPSKENEIMITEIDSEEDNNCEDKNQDKLNQSQGKNSGKSINKIQKQINKIQQKVERILFKELFHNKKNNLMMIKIQIDRIREKIYANTTLNDYINDFIKYLMKTQKNNFSASTLERILEFLSKSIRSSSDFLNFVINHDILSSEFIKYIILPIEKYTSQIKPEDQDEFQKMINKFTKIVFKDISKMKYIE